MAVLNRRTRIVSFRVSEEEYHDLVNLCLTRQARSISDFARFVTLSQFKMSASDAEPGSPLTQIHRELGVIGCELKRLAELIEPQPPDGPPSFKQLRSSGASWGATTE
jgi:hypothetical protein